MPPSLLMDALDSVFQMVADLGVSPVVAGGLAVSYWGYPRSTRDIDLAILITSIDDFDSSLRRAGLVPAKQQHLAQLGFVQVSQWRIGFPDSLIDIEIDFLISESPYHAMAIQRATDGQLPGAKSQMRILTCEDLLLFKAKSGRLIDLADIEVLLELHRDQLDFAYMLAKSQEIGLNPARWKTEV